MCKHYGTDVYTCGKIVAMILNTIAYCKWIYIYIYNIIRYYIIYVLLMHKTYGTHGVIARGRNGPCFTRLGIQFHRFAFLDYIDVCNFKQQTWRFQQIEIGIRHKCGCAKEKHVNLFKSYSTVSISAAAFGNSAEKEKKVESAGCVLNGMQREFFMIHHHWATRISTQRVPLQETFRFSLCHCKVARLAVAPAARCAVGADCCAAWCSGRWATTGSSATSAQRDAVFTAGAEEWMAGRGDLRPHDATMEFWIGLQASVNAINDLI